MSGSPDADFVRDAASTEWSVPEPVAPMLKNQAVLPRLPVPPLGETCLRYLKSVRPLLSDAEFARTRTAVLDFALSEQAAKLQERLVARAAAKSGSSWLIDWWNARAYLADRGPVVFWVSYFYLFDNIVAQIPRAPGAPPAQPQCVAAAAVTDCALDFRARIVGGALSPDEVAGRPQCMAAYRLLFNSCRVPAFPADVVASYASEAHTHVLALRRGRIFVVETHAPLPEGAGSGVAGSARPAPLRLSRRALEKQFARVIAAADAAGEPELPPGALTSGERDEWARTRAAMLALPGGNAAALRQIESAAFAVCLDAEAPPATDVVGRGRACWHGDGRSRWFDKTLQFVVFPDGQLGFLGEHALSDGGQTLRVCDALLHEARAAPAPTPRAEAAAAPTELQLTLLGDVAAAARGFMARFDATAADHQAALLVVEGMGRAGIKRLGVPPDPFVQLALQLAFFRLAGRPGPTYEAASTRSFLHGRTETIRSCSPEAATFVRSMQDPTATPAARRAALTAAAAAHRRQAAECGAGRGIDRHLLGMRVLLGEDGAAMPPIFTDPAFAKSSGWEMSTSNLSHERLQAWGFGEVVEQGFGVGYSILSARLQFFVTCKGSRDAGPSRAEAFKETLQLSLRDMEQLCALQTRAAL